MRLSLSAKTPSVLLLSATLIMLLLAAFVSAPAKTIVAQESAAQLWTTAEWIAWRDQQITLILAPTLDAQGAQTLPLKEVWPRCLPAYRKLESCLRQDPTFLSAVPERTAALGNFYRFVKAQHWMALAANAGDKEPNALGMEVTDEEYATIAAPFVRFPDLLQSQDFLTRMASPGTYQEALQRIADHNASLPPEQKWIPLFYKSQFITTADEAKTYGRLLVLIPNEPFGESGMVDRWVQFGIAPPDLKPVPEIRSVSMVTVYRDAAAPDRTQTFFTDFMRLNDPQTGQYRIVSNFVLPNDPSKNCYNCHKSAVMPIHPDVEYAFDANRNLVPRAASVGIVPDIVNRRIMGYGKPEQEHLDTDAYGPCLGPPDKTRSDAFIRNATQGLNLPVASYDKIRNAMKCAGCHESFAPLNYPQTVRSDMDRTAFKGAKGIVQTYIENGYMPPGVQLSPVEKKALWQCLIQEYYDPNAQQGLLIDWLKGSSVSGQSRSASSPNSRNACRACSSNFR